MLCTCEQGSVLGVAFYKNGNIFQTTGISIIELAFK